MDAENLAIAAPSPRRWAIWLLIASAVLTVALWQMPGGNYALYPFTILSTWFHEMGHGLAALALGGEFRGLALFANGSGMATYALPADHGSMAPALVAASGPLGPAVAGAVFIWSGRYPITAKLCLLILGAMLLLAVVLWAKTSFGVTAMVALGGSILLIATLTAPWLQAFAIQFFGVQACISTYQQMDYLFMRAAEVNGQHMLSDTGQIAHYVGLPHWFWAIALLALSAALLAGSLRLAYR